MKLSASKAAKEVGVSIPTITRAIKSGKMSAEPVEGGGWMIDPAELFRVFPAVTANSNDTPVMSGDETPNESRVLQVRIDMLREQFALMEKALERSLADKDAQIADLRIDRDKWRDQVEIFNRRLEGPKPEALGRVWWPFRRANDAR